MSNVLLITRFSETDARLFRQGMHLHLHDQLGAHPAVVDGNEGVVFGVWAPQARHVAVMGDFNGWDKTSHPLHRHGSSGIWEGFVTEARAGTIYKYSIVGQDGIDRDKADPFGFFHETPPRNASIVWQLDYSWNDEGWIGSRSQRRTLDDPMSCYELHLGSWIGPGGHGTENSYRAVTDRLADYVRRLGFTHVELMPVMEYFRDASWGYETTGYFAPTSRFGTPQDLMYLVDRLHQSGIGVILDWTPSYFGRHEHSLNLFDGSPLLETEEAGRGERTWCKFHYGRREVCSFLASSAYFWIERYHVDGLRMVGISSMLYPDTADDQVRTTGEHVGGEDLDAVFLLQRLNESIAGDHPAVITIADGSPRWPMVCWPVKAAGGLGFGFQWDRDWARDSIDYLQHEIHQRGEHHREMTRHMLDAFNENIVLPLSHDEVAEEQGQQSLLERLPADEWQKFANLRLLLGYLYTHPGKKLLFMGAEFGARSAWHFARPLDWLQAGQPRHSGLQNWVTDLNRVYRDEPALYEFDRDAEGFEWVDAHDEIRCVLTFLRKGWKSGDFVLAVCNFTPQPRTNYRIGVPAGGDWKEILNSDVEYYGGSGWGNMGGLQAAPIPFHDRPYSINATLPPLAIVVFKHER